MLNNGRELKQVNDGTSILSVKSLELISIDLEYDNVETLHDEMRRWIRALI